MPMEISGSLSVEDQERPTGKDRGLNGHIRQISSPSLSALEDTRIPAHGNNVEVDQTLAGTGVTTTTSWPDCGYAPSLRLSSSGSAATSTNETHSRAPESRIPRELVRHLPVFSALRRGIPAAPLTPPSPAPQIGGERFTTKALGVFCAGPDCLVFWKGHRGRDGGFGDARKNTAFST